MEIAHTTIIQLLEKIRNGDASVQDCDLLKQSMNGEDAEQVTVWVMEYYEAQELEFKGKYSQWRPVYQNILAFDKAFDSNEVPVAAPVKSLLLKRWWAAASVIALLGIGIYFFGGIKKQYPASDVKTVVAEIPAPASNKALIALADGSKVYLDSANNGLMAVQGHAKLMKDSNGRIVYESLPDKKVQELQYNTLTNPRGSKVIHMTLTDGSKLWLNAGSSVTYPVTFVGNERKVKLTGEAYFDIAKDAAKPFLVEVNNMVVEVLGTMFNINAYDDEPAIRTTLLQGAVKVTLNDKQLLLSPGQQAVVAGRALQLNGHVNPDEVVAWKDGLFLFENKDAKAIMNQLSRWYDLEIEYQGESIDELFSATLSREQPLSKVLNYLQQTGHIHFTVLGRKIIVKP